MALVTWFMANYIELFACLSLIILVAELITRLTPTQTDDGFVKRVGGVIDTIMSILGIPNIISAKSWSERISFAIDFAKKIIALFKKK